MTAIGAAFLVATRRSARDRLADALAEVATLADEVDTRDRRLEVMLAASGTGFWEWDIASGQLTWSDAIFGSTAWSPSRRAPDFATYLEIIHPDDRGRFASAIEARWPGAAAVRPRVPGGLAGRAVHWTHGAGRVLSDDGGRAVRMIGTGQDITERRRVEEQRDRLLADERRAGEFREAFIDVISHELRTPITTILGLTQILARPGRATIRERAPPCSSTSGSESGAPVPARRGPPRPEPRRSAAARRRRRAARAAPDPRADRRAEAAELVDPSTSSPDLCRISVVAGEDTYVEQILRNLLGNAAKYSPAAPRSSSVTARRSDSVVESG